MHFDREHKQFIFSSRGGSSSAYALTPAQVGPFPQTLPDYVPTQVPIPARDVYPQPATAGPDTERGALMAHDWGHVFRTAVGGFIGGIAGGGTQTSFPDYGGPLSMADPGEIGPVERVLTGGLGAESCEGMVWSGGTPPKGYKVVNSCGVGVLRKVRRRRRRRLLTASDKADISYIVATTGKGQLAASLIHRSAQ